MLFLYTHLYTPYLTISYNLSNPKITQDNDNNKEPTKEEQQELERIKQTQIAKQLPQYKSNYDLFHTSVTTNGDLRNFYYLACGEEQTLVELQDEEDNSNGGQGSGVKGSGRKFSFEDPIVNNSDKQQQQNGSSDNKKRKNRKKKKNKSNTNTAATEVSDSSGSENEATNNPNNNQPTTTAAVTTNAKYLLDIESQLAKLNKLSCIPITIALSGYNPPPSHRLILGDLAYLVVTLPDNQVVHVTAIPQGFYINKSTEKKFNPTPDINEGSSNNQDSMACYSHSLLDTLLQKSKSFRTVYTTALLASKQRSELLSSTSFNESTLYNFFRPLVSPFSTNNLSGSNTSLVGGLLAGLVLNSNTSSGSTSGSNSGMFSSRIDMVTVKPSWLVPPLPSVNCSGNGSSNGGSGKGSGGSNLMLGKKLETYNHSTLHEYSINRLENELMNNMYGMDIRGGGLRDWNEELQVARELSVDTFGERVDRAR